MSNPPITFKLRNWRRNNSLSQAAAALQLGVARRTWHQWETAARVPSPELMVALVALTAGAVEPNDFYVLPERSAA